MRLLGASPVPPPAWVAGLLGRPGLAVAFGWGMAEAMLFFLVPDILLTLVAVFGGWRSVKHLGATVAGAVVGGTAMYASAVAWPAAAVAAVDAVPFVREWMFAQAHADYARVGVWAPCFGPPAGVPYKVHAVLAPTYVAWPAFLLVTIPARMERLALTWLACAAGGRIARRAVHAYPRSVLALHAATWTVMVAWYWSAV